jgi:hypothetical protein
MVLLCSQPEPFCPKNIISWHALPAGILDAEVVLALGIHRILCEYFRGIRNISWRGIRALRLFFGGGLSLGMKLENWPGMVERWKAQQGGG